MSALGVCLLHQPKTGGLVHKSSEKALGKSASFTRLVLDSLDEHVAVLDERGNIVAVNEAWENFAIQNGAAEMSRVSRRGQLPKRLPEVDQGGESWGRASLEGSRVCVERHQTPLCFGL